MRLTIFLWLLSAFSFLPSVQAWTFVWRNASNDSFVEHSKSSMSCKKVSNPKGMLFEYDSEEGPFEISLYENSDCSGSPSGWASHLFTKNASAAIDSFKVDSTATTTSSSMTTTTSSTSTSTQPATSTSVANTPSDSGSSSDLSGGEIAGIVIGVVAGVTIIGVVLFFLGRRRRALVNNPAPISSMGYAPSAYGSPDTYTSPSSFGRGMASLDAKKQEHVPPPSSTQGSSNAPVRVVELPGDYNAAELSNNAARTELEGQIRSPGSS